MAKDVRVRQYQMTKLRLRLILLAFRRWPRWLNARAALCVLLLLVLVADCFRHRIKALLQDGMLLCVGRSIPHAKFVQCQLVSLGKLGHNLRNE